VEAPWYELKDIMQVQEQLLSYICHRIAVERKNELKLLGREPSDLLKINPPFQKITYDEALNKLNREGIDLSWGDDLGWDTEKYLAKMFNEPFFVTHYPKSAKAFYHNPDPDRSNVTLSADLLAPEGYGEITGGGQRIDNIDQLIQRIEEEKLKPEDYQWYIDLRKYGSVTHSGFGMGIERAVAWIAKLEHIRDAIAFPRLINRVYP
jgi:asparaginyl-tRNA synthetase